VKSARPPLFFRREGPFVRALQMWPSSALNQACARIWELERACKRTGTPVEVICRNAILELAQQGAAARHGSDPTVQGASTTGTSG